MFMQTTTRFQIYKRAHIRSRDSFRGQGFFQESLFLVGEGWERLNTGGNQVVFQNSLGLIMKMASEQSAK